MNYWWVNQNQTYEHEVPGGFLWSPKTRRDGAYNQFYENMRQVQPGDVIFSFCDTYIKAVGVARGTADTSPKPAFGAAGAGWSDEGWLVPVDFAELESPVRPKDHIERLRPFLPEKYSPLRHDGDGLQSVYLAAVPQRLAQELLDLLGDSYVKAWRELGRDQPGDADDGLQRQIVERTDIGPVVKRQLVLARRGQGVFRKNVQAHEQMCRITMTADLDHLVASHIKPWRECDDAEKLDGCNGLLLAPHIDHLFDKGYITFSEAGDLVVSPGLSHVILESWGIPRVQNVGQFNERQRRYLAFHRGRVFRDTLQALEGQN